ncbi:unnamed protein product [Eretmochelys imbricata]
MSKRNTFSRDWPRRRGRLKKLKENVTKLSQQSSSLQQLITEIEEKCQQPDAELLQDVKGTLARSEQVRLQGPELSAAELKNPYRVPGMMDVLREFIELQEEITSSVEQAVQHHL